MYLKNKYTTWYYSIITQAQNRVNHEGYFEKHHIISKSLGGTNDPINLVKLTAKEHYICHLLLIRMTEGISKNKMRYAAWMMVKNNPYQDRIINSRRFQTLKEQLKKANKERPGPNLGKKMSEEQKKKIGEAQKGIPKGPMSLEHREKLRKPKSEETKRKLSLARLGKSWGHKHSSETKKKMSDWQKGVPKPKIQCEHCNKVVSDLNYRRWHGNNCKSK
jgi:NUMOD3 motif